MKISSFFHSFEPLLTSTVPVTKAVAPLILYIEKESASSSNSKSKFKDSKMLTLLVAAQGKFYKAVYALGQKTRNNFGDLIQIEASRDFRMNASNLLSAVTEAAELMLSKKPSSLTSKDLVNDDEEEQMDVADENDQDENQESDEESDEEIEEMEQDGSD